MGDISTHVVFYQAYWYLVYQSHDVWVDSRTQETVCHLDAAEKLIQLGDAQ